MQNTATSVEILSMHVCTTFWNLSQLLGLFTCHKLAKLSWNFVTETSNNSRNYQAYINYVAKNWALATMLKALPLVHFWRLLLMREQMVTSDDVKNTGLISAKLIDSSEICSENNRKIGCFLPIGFWGSLRGKFPRNWPIFLQICPYESKEIWLFFPRPMLIRSPVHRKQRNMEPKELPSCTIALLLIT